jgi:sterol desaturase/sphingolipid hydroxylase (fatty acid hydroxylase superfamily)
VARAAEGSGACGVSLLSLLHLAARFRDSYGQFLYTGLALWVFEALFPAAPLGPGGLRGRIRGAGLIAVAVFVASAVAAPIHAFATAHLPNLLGGWSLNAAVPPGPWHAPWVYLVVPCLGMLWGDFFFYWCHRLQHASPLLWRFHSLHHATRELNVFTQLSHWTEPLTQLAFISLPQVFLHLQYQGVGVLWFAFRFWNAFIHSDIRTEWWVWRWIFGGSQYHRIHHSQEPQHFGKNYSFFPFWDLVFGTFHNPRPGEWPATGLADGPDTPRTLGQFLAWGFRF